MWVGEPSGGLLDALSKAGTVAAPLFSVIAYFIGTHVRARVNDAEQMAVTNAVERLEKVISQLVEHKTKTQDHLENITEKITQAFRDIKEVRRDVAKNAGSIENIKGRLQK